MRIREDPISAIVVKLSTVTGQNKGLEDPPNHYGNVFTTKLKNGSATT
jgi:hypothetical protein